MDGYDSPYSAIYRFVIRDFIMSKEDISLCPSEGKKNIVIASSSLMHEMAGMVYYPQLSYAFSASLLCCLRRSVIC